MRALSFSRVLAPRRELMAFLPCYNLACSRRAIFSRSDAGATRDEGEAKDTKSDAAPNSEAKEAQSTSLPSTFAKLEKELDESKRLVEELRKDVLYRAADAENARRNGRQDVEKAKRYAISAFAKDMLELADTLEKALEAFGNISPCDETTDASNGGNGISKHVISLHKGVEMSYKILLTNLGKHGVTKMNVKEGTQFDPNVHEALARLPATEKSPADTIAHVMKDGYMIKDRVLRAAQVGVAGDN